MLIHCTVSKLLVSLLYMNEARSRVLFINHYYSILKYLILVGAAKQPVLREERVPCMEHSVEHGYTSRAGPCAISHARVPLQESKIEMRLNGQFRQKWDALCMATGRRAGQSLCVNMMIVQLATQISNFGESLVRIF